jgi:hypothetical protein
MMEGKGWIGKERREQSIMSRMRSELKLIYRGQGSQAGR